MLKLKGNNADILAFNERVLCRILHLAFFVIASEKVKPFSYFHKQIHNYTGNCTLSFKQTTMCIFKKCPDTISTSTQQEILSSKCPETTVHDFKKCSGVSTELFVQSTPGSLPLHKCDHILIMLTLTYRYTTIPTFHISIYNNVPHHSCQHTSFILGNKTDTMCLSHIWDRSQCCFHFMCKTSKIVILDITIILHKWLKTPFKDIVLISNIFDRIAKVRNFKVGGNGAMGLSVLEYQCHPNSQFNTLNYYPWSIFRNTYKYCKCKKNLFDVCTLFDTLFQKY